MPIHSTVMGNKQSTNEGAETKSVPKYGDNLDADLDDSDDDVETKGVAKFGDNLDSDLDGSDDDAETKSVAKFGDNLDADLDDSDYDAETKGAAKYGDDLDADLDGSDDDAETFVTTYGFNLDTGLNGSNDDAETFVPTYSDNLDAGFDDSNDDAESKSVSKYGDNPDTDVETKSVLKYGDNPDTGPDDSNADDSNDGRPASSDRSGHSTDYDEDEEEKEKADRGAKRVREQLLSLLDRLDASLDVWEAASSSANNGSPNSAGAVNTLEHVSPTLEIVPETGAFSACTLKREYGPSDVAAFSAGTLELEHGPLRAGSGDAAFSACTPELEHSPLRAGAPSAGVVAAVGARADAERRHAAATCSFTDLQARAGRAASRQQQRKVATTAAYNEAQTLPTPRGEEGIADGGAGGAGDGGAGAAPIRSRSASPSGCESDRVAADAALQRPEAELQPRCQSWVACGRRESVVMDSDSDEGGDKDNQAEGGGGSSRPNPVMACVGGRWRARRDTDADRDLGAAWDECMDDELRGAFDEVYEEYSNGRSSPTEPLSSHIRAGAGGPRVVLRRKRCVRFKSRKAAGGDGGDDEGQLEMDEMVS